MALKARFIREIGTRAYLRVYQSVDGLPCPGGSRGYHNAQVHIATSGETGHWTLGGDASSYPTSMWPVQCDSCPFIFSDGAKKCVFRERLYDSPSGKPEPGDMFYADWMHWDTVVTSRNGMACPPTTCSAGWSNCSGLHLVAILPDGHQWDLDGRASNCDMKNDFEHRCWVRHGEPPMITVDKNGRTCNVGAGSILSPTGWHGFLRAGEFVL